MTTDAEVVVGALEVEEGLNEPEVQEGFETMLVIHCTLLRSKEQHSLHVITVKRIAFVARYYGQKNSPVISIS
jgi:hypothetical protein